MGRRLFIMSVFGLATLFRPAAAQDVAGKYVWPISGYTNLSAGFCDFRARHYHGGIDLSTNGQEGLPVRAADSGWVMRVSTGYWGYGKAVYVQMAGGMMAVYGHLSELSDEIQAFVEAEQYKSRRYSQNLFPARNEIPISRGEVIGKSGQTGAGPPHLHFEIRTKDNKPLNPLIFFDKPDAIRPSVYSITITPIQPNDLDTPPSTVDGSLLPKTYPIAMRTLAVTPHVTGRVGISILADDNIDAPRWTMSAYRHRLTVNDAQVGEVRYDSINYDDTRQIEIERVFDPDGGLSPRAVNLFRREHNTLWHYYGFVNDGILSESAGFRHGKNAVRIDVEDFAGNQTGVSFSIMYDSLPQRGALASTSTSLGSVLTWGGSALTVVSTSNSPPEVSLDAEGNQKIGHWIRAKSGWQAWLPASMGADVLWVSGKAGAVPTPATLGWRTINSEDGGLITSEDGRATVSVAAGDLYVPGGFTLRQSAAGSKSGALTPIYTLSPRDIPFARDLRITIDIPDTKSAPEKLAIYRNRNGSWSFEGNEREKDRNALRATIKSVGSFAILSDRTPPVIANVTPGKGESVRDPRPWIRFQVTDNLSGIGSDEHLQLTIDGEWVPVEYDPDLRQAKARPRWKLDPGKHTVVIVARDNCGNETRFERILTVQ
jgi:hypothetical protein